MTDNAEHASPATRLETVGGVATITLAQPEHKNSLGAALVESLLDDLARAIDDDVVRVVVLTNDGNTFCAGADLKASAPGVSEGPAGRTFVDVFRAIRASPKPVVARVDGHATGGGVGLVAVCDLSVMRDDAKIGFTEARLGVAPAVISVVCLPKMRRGDAAELFLRAQRFTPSRAAEVGLINLAVPADELDDAIERYVDDLVRGGPLALAACKEILDLVPGLDPEEGFAVMAERSQALFRSEEAQAGIAAFRERAAAPWVPSDRR